MPSYEVYYQLPPSTNSRGDYEGRIVPVRCNGKPLVVVASSGAEALKCVQERGFAQHPLLWRVLEPGETFASAYEMPHD